MARRRPPENGIAAGTVIGGRYVCEYRVAGGAMGDVWAARHMLLHLRVALKVIKDPDLCGPDASERFEREARAGAYLATQTEHVVRVHDYGFDPRGPFIAMELLFGETLEARLASVGRLSRRKTAAILAQIARALRKAHAAGIVLRDIKPENVYLARYPGEDERVKLLDFGVVKILPQGGGPATTLVAGTPAYMSPETANGEPIDRRADLWAVAVLLYEMVCGRPPFLGHDCEGVLRSVRACEVEPPSHLVPRLGRQMDDFFGKALARDISQRHQNIDQLEAGFLAACRPSPGSTPPGAPSGPSSGPSSGVASGSARSGAAAPPSSRAVPSSDSFAAHAPTELMHTRRPLAS